jgi:NAD(P)-dependent dehydrogenase (short-subunit alcohol dehydrogenase family)
VAKHEVVGITGASAGVGRAAVHEFARHGAWIGLVARGRDGLEAARREVEAEGGKAIVLPRDVADPAQVEAAAQQVETKLGPIDIWVLKIRIGRTIFGSLCPAITARTEAGKHARLVKVEAVGRARTD